MSTNYTEKFNNTFQMLNYYQEEFLYRHKHFWNVLTKSVILISTITTIPITSEFLGIVVNDMVKDYMFVFPILGIILSISCFCILLDEGKKMKAISKTKLRINNELPIKYRCERYTSKCSLATILSILLLVSGIVLSILVFLMANEKIPENSSVYLSIL